jgi:putrescine transport system permease protein
VSATTETFVRRLGWLPIAWMTVFLVLPVLLIGKVSLAESVLAQPPFTALVEWTDGGLEWLASGAAFEWIAEDPYYREALGGSFLMALATTAACLALALPMAWTIARAGEAWRLPLLLLVILPFWTSFLIRVYAWMGILKPRGVLNAVLMEAGLIDAPLEILHTDGAVLLGMTYAYLPFMIMPLYATFARLDLSVLEAAADLGATPARAFFTVALPMARPGLIAGCLLVFIPAMGEFVVPDLLGGPDTLMIGRVLWDEFFRNADWPTASALALILLAILLVPIAVLNRLQGDRPGDGAA